MTHICVGRLNIIGSDNGLSSGPRNGAHFVLASIVNGSHWLPHIGFEFLCTFEDIWRHWIVIGSCDGLLPGGSKLLPELILTRQQKGPVAFI